MSRSCSHALGLFLVTALAQPAAADVVTDWNRTAIDAMNAAKTVLDPQARNLAMMHVAMSDAVNSVQRRYATHGPGGAPMPGASAEAAAAAAARAVLLPTQKALIDQAFGASMKAIPDGPARNDGVAIGEKCAAAVIAERAADWEETRKR